MNEFSSTLFGSPSPRPRRLQAFAGSTLIHCVLIAGLSLWHVKAPPVNVISALPPQYSIRFLHLQMPKNDGSKASATGKQSSSPGTGRLAKSEPSERPAQTAPPSRSSESGEASPIQASIVHEHRQFQLPPQTHPQPAPQTIVQMDLPPDIVLKHEIPVPTVVLWTQPKLPPPARRQFVAPPVKTPSAPRNLTVAVALEPPNQETVLSNVNIAPATVLNNLPHLPQPPSIAPPVSRSAPETATEIPQIGLATGTDSSAANLISLPKTPLRSAGILALPPANQIAPQDIANAGSLAGDGGGHGAQDSGSQGLGSARAGAVGNQGTAGNQVQAGDLNGSGSLPAARSTGSGNSNSGGVGAGAGAGAVASMGNGAGATGSAGDRGNGNAAGGASAGGSSTTGGNGSSTGPGERLPGVTRINQAKTGKFGVVVLGSADSTRYPEGSGALSGKIVYTVYLRLGLRKNWILQYSLPNVKENSGAAKGSLNPVEAPWPFLIERPDQWSASDPEYIMLHGIVTPAGRFDQLAMIFPNEFERKDLLLSSLKLWEFRPASQDGIPKAIEVLLIIPREVE